MPDNLRSRASIRTHLIFISFALFGYYLLATCSKQEETEDDLWIEQQAASNGLQNRSLPTVTVLRIASILDADLGFRAARDVFHSLPRWNDRFVVKIHSHYTKRAAGQSVASTLQLALRALEEPNKTFVGMLGPDYTAEVQFVAQITPIYSMNNVIMSASASLNDVSTYPLQFRVTSPSNEELRAMTSLLEMLNIRQVSTLALAELAYVLSVRSFTRYFTDRMNGTIQNAVVMTDDVDVDGDIKQLLSKNTVEYIVDNIGANMRYAICSVYKATSEWTLRPTFLGLDFWDVRDLWRLPGSNCSLDELRSAFNGSIFVSYINPNYITDREYLTRPRHDGLTLEQIQQKIRAIPQSAAMLRNVTSSPFSYTAYDGGFALFTALYRVDKRMEDEKFGGGIRLHQLDAKKTSPLLWQQFASMLHDELAATSFDGASVVGNAGRVTFDKNHGRTGGIELIQYQGPTIGLDGQLVDNFVQVGYLGSDSKVRLNLQLLKFRTPTGEAPHVWLHKYIELHNRESGNTPSIGIGTIVIIVAGVVVAALIVLTTLVFLWQYKRLKRSRQQQNLTWLLPHTSLLQEQTTMHVTEGSLSRRSESNNTSALLLTSKSSVLSLSHPSSAVYYVKNHIRVYIRPMTTSAPMASLDAAELNKKFEPAAAMHLLSQENVNQFIGICLDYRSSSDIRESINAISIAVFEYQEKYSLRRTLQEGNAEWSVDAELKRCFSADCVRGMRAIHQAGIVHGFLHTGNIVLDAKLTCKITNYGLAKFGRDREELEPVSLDMVSEELVTNLEFVEKLGFRSPEQLRKGYYGCDIIKSDIFSVGMVLVEILTRKPPRFVTLAEPATPLTPKQMVKGRLQLNNSESMVPHLNTSDASLALRSVVLEFVRENPTSRPSMDNAFKSLMQLQEFASVVSVVESLVLRLQRYADDLEVVVTDRTQALFEEARRSEQLLLQILPASVAAELKAGRQVQPEYFERVSVYFSDIVDFATTIGARLAPMQVVDLLNSLYMAFDGVLEKYNVYKVETIGDAYMVASGLPLRNEHQHADELCRFSLAMLKTIQNLPSNAMCAADANTDGCSANVAIHLRIGLHCGPCMAGVIGIRLPRYCLFGDTINTASRMQSTGQPNKIHCSTAMRTFTELHFPDRDQQPLAQLQELALIISVLESFVLPLRRYANDHELVVTERTQALFEEARRSEQLLLQILPASVVSGTVTVHGRCDRDQATTLLPIRGHNQYCQPNAVEWPAKQNIHRSNAVRTFA